MPDLCKILPDYCKSLSDPSFHRAMPEAQPFVLAQDANAPPSPEAP